MKIDDLRGNHLRKKAILATVSGVASTKKELIELYAKRFSETGFRYGEDTVPFPSSSFFTG